MTDTQTSKPKPLCFVTVSRTLSRELTKRYAEAEKLAQRKLCAAVSFFVLRDLLEMLLRRYQINIDMSSLYSFTEYVENRKSHENLDVKASLIENEIGGVILGSLTAALERRPLSRTQYLVEKRSNVPTDTQEGCRMRELIYAEFERYNRAKAERYDMNDVILQLIKFCEENPEEFQAGECPGSSCLYFLLIVCRLSHGPKSLSLHR